MPNPRSFELPQEFLIVGAAVQTGLFDALKDSPCTTEELSAKTGTDHRALWTVAEALVALGYLEHDSKKMKLTAEAEEILYNSESEAYTGFSFMHAYNLISSWVRLPEVLQNGKPVPKKQDSAPKDFIKAMSHIAAQSAPALSKYCLQDLPANPAVLDVGGGPLTYARAFAKNGAAVTVMDLPQVIDMMSPELEPDLPIKMVKGDFTEGLPQGPFDVIYLGNVCHIYGEKENQKLFNDAAANLKSGGRLIINDMIRGTGARPAIFGVNMLINTANGGTYTYEEYKTWLENAQFSVFPWQEVGGRQIIRADRQ